APEPAAEVPAPIPPPAPEPAAEVPAPIPPPPPAEEKPKTAAEPPKPPPATISLKSDEAQKPEAATPPPAPAAPPAPPEPPKPAAEDKPKEKSDAKPVISLGLKQATDAAGAAPTPPEPPKPASDEKPKISLGLNKPDDKSAEEKPKISLGLSKPDQDPAEEKPKISLGLSKPSPASPAAPPAPAQPDKKEEPVAEEKPPADQNEQPPQIETPKPGILAKAKKETSKLSLDDAKASLNTTMAIEDMPTVVQGVPGRIKKETSRIDLPTTSNVGTPAVQKVSAANVVKGIPSKMKSETSKLDIKAATGPTPDVAEKAKEITDSLDNMLKQAQEATMRIEIEDTKNPTEMTQQVETIGRDALRERTTKVDLSNILGKDAQGQKTVVKPRGAAASAAAPKTMKIRRPGGAPAKTVKKAGDEAPTVAPSGAGGGESESGIELPGDNLQGAPTVQRKTIRIKRPDGAGSSPGKALTISRPSVGEMKEGEEPPPPPTMANMMQEEEGPTTGVLSLIGTLAATIVACVLVYVLVAQFNTIYKGQEDQSSMPFAGMIEVR
ncbi:MAG: hypothetical protein AAF492_10670, partial [Verrucomicrobiota bacterium]